MIATITMQELQCLTAQQLGELHQFFSSLLTEPTLDEAERRNILATLENLERAMGYPARPTPRGFTMQP
ncbi:MAG: hypothetical protein IE937_00660 [Gammaproteobacteria bacterium]|uniref:Uncharacterized protein n=1 Tax=Thioclava marina TaxID=1915077 RepID=A0ABX3MKS0_9RHOB|nr:hypothetical protein [Thioclava marina]MBD3754133.1 hypothetical protein [Gammaproteobacteria bacterium]OOY11783.1 hypothetical protein BMG00_11900 [Thioclava marina]